VRQAREHLAEIDENLASGRALSWAIAEARDPDGPLRGEIAVQVGPDGRQGEIGYWAHPVARGRGLTTAAVRLAARHALLPPADGGLGMSRVLLRIAEHNTASLRIAHRLGFHPSGVDRDGERLRDGTVQDMLRFDLLADECP
jgi:RimJ/RimL family protein N-acetyltransferase